MRISEEGVAAAEITSNQICWRISAGRLVKDSISVDANSQLRA